MEDGSTKPIGEVELGDRVRTVDEETGKDSGRSWKVVATVHRKGVKALTTVTVAVGLAAGALPAGADAGGVARDGLGGGVVSVESTDGHRFLVTQPAAAAGVGVAREAGTETDGNGAANTTLGVSPGGGNGPVWTDAGDLNVGDQVALERNRVGVVTGTITTRRETDVFNLSVDGDHTFLVTPTPQSADGRINPARGPPAVVTHNTNCGPDESVYGPLKLKYKEDWSAAQRAAADRKVAQLNQSDLLVTPARRSQASAKSRYARAGYSVPGKSDVDHVVDLQLGGADDVANMSPLDRSVNRSLGSQINKQIRNLEPGAKICGVTICDR